MLESGVPGHVVLTGRSLGLCRSLIEIGRREQLLVGELPGPGELGDRELVCSLGVGDFGHALHLERGPVRDTQARLDLGDVGLGLVGLRRDFDGGDANQFGALGDVAAALDRRGNDPPGNLGRDLRLFPRDERAADPNEAGNRLLGYGETSDRDRGGPVLAGEHVSLRAAAGERADADGEDEDGGRSDS